MVTRDTGRPSAPPVSLDQPERIRAIRQAFARQDVTLAEVGVWNNMLDPDPARRAANLEANVHALALADEVGALCCPSRYYRNADFLHECFSKLGPRIVSCHAKDIIMRDQLTVHLDEVRPGLGALDYKVFLEELSRLPGDVPLLLEHLPQEEYKYVVAVAAQIGLSFHTPKRRA